jgi:hypothetical protein
VKFHKLTETSNSLTVLRDEDDAEDGDSDAGSASSSSSAEQEADRIRRWKQSIAEDPPAIKISASTHVDDWDLELLCAYYANFHNESVKIFAREHKLRFWPAVQRITMGLFDKEPKMAHYFLAKAKNWGSPRPPTPGKSCRDSVVSPKSVPKVTPTHDFIRPRTYATTVSAPRSIAGKSASHWLNSPTVAQDKAVNAFEVNTVPSPQPYGPWESVQVIVDSGACNHVGPLELGKDFPLLETNASRDGQCFSGADGSKMRNLGCKDIFATTDFGDRLGARE